MVDWFAGKRVRGTSSERTPLGVTLGGTGVGGWVELARTTLGSASDNLNVTSLPDKRYYMVLGDFKATGGSISADLRLNSDTGLNYSDRYCANGGADATVTSNDFIRSGIGLSTPEFIVGYLANYSSKEKLYLGHSVWQNTAGAGTAPQRVEMTGKHAQTSNPISAVNYIDRQAGQFASGSEVVVLGYDPADTHSSNFWQELASTTWSSGASISSGVFTPKKYLWIQGYVKHDGSAGGAVTAQVGNTTVDTGSNYAWRDSENGGADGTGTSASNIPYLGGSGTGTANALIFFNAFIINNASNEKLGISHNINVESAGATNAPTYREEQVFKWANTSNQIDIITLTRGANALAGGELKVWGAD